MNLLLDTQAFIWFVEDDKNLPKSVKQKLEDEKNILYISIASLWEMAIKVSLGKLKLVDGLQKVIENIDSNGFAIVGIETNHIIHLGSLAYHHRDPFDRIIASQCSSEKFTIVSSDEIFDKYKVKRIW